MKVDVPLQALGGDVGIPRIGAAVELEDLALEARDEWVTEDPFPRWVAVFVYIKVLTIEAEAIGIIGNAVKLFDKETSAVGISVATSRARCLHFVVSNTNVVVALSCHAVLSSSGSGVTVVQITVVRSPLERGAYRNSGVFAVLKALVLGGVGGIACGNVDNVGLSRLINVTLARSFTDQGVVSSKEATVLADACGRRLKEWAPEFHAKNIIGDFGEHGDTSEGEERHKCHLLGGDGEKHGECLCAL